MIVQDTVFTLSFGADEAAIEAARNLGMGYDRLFHDEPCGAGSGQTLNML